MMLAGIIAIGAPLATGITVNVLIAWMLLVSGAAHLAYGWQTRDNGSFLWELLVSVVHGIAALYLLMQPIGALASLTAVLALYLAGKATLEIIASLQHRSIRGSGWLFFDGIFTLILAIMIWMRGPGAHVPDWDARGAQSALLAARPVCTYCSRRRMHRRAVNSIPR
jgi:uncharacterized membrane protein HdeD (DUF308 family)